MKSPRSIGLIVFLLAAVGPVDISEAENGVAARQESPAAKPAEPLNQKERTFKETITGTEWTGKWRLIENGELKEEHSEKYVIQSADKAGGDLWVIFAKVKYGEKEVTVPVPVQVLWAGDTPVITLNKLSIPNLGTYSARVVVHDQTYSGIWSGGDHRGFLQGVIKKGQSVAPETRP